MDKEMITTKNKYDVDKSIEKYQWFFCSFLHEILDINCHPLYKKKNINTKALINEILDYLKSEQILIKDSQMKILIKEFLFIHKRDPVFKRYQRDARILIKKIQEIGEQKEIIKYKEELLNLFKILEYEVDKTYTPTLQGLLNSFLDKKFFNEDNLDYRKKISELENLIYIFISELAKRYTDRYLLYFCINKFYKGSNFNADYDNLLSLLLMNKKIFNCYLGFNISCSSRVKIIEKLSLDKLLEPVQSFLIKKEEFKSKISLLNNRYKPKTDDLFTNFNHHIKFRLEGYDIYNIADRARDELVSKLDIILYQNNFLSINIADEILIQEEKKEENIFLHNLGRDRNFNIDETRKNITTKAFDVLSNKNNLYKDSTITRIKDSLKYYRTYLRENNSDSALLNLWIALESLFSNDKKTNNFDLIKSMIPMVVCFYYLREAFDELQLHILQRIEREKEKNIENGTYFKLKGYVEENNIYKKRLEDEIRETKTFNNVGLFRVLSDPDKKNYFINQINDPYYCHKYEMLNDKIVDIKNFLELNYSINQWEIYRIYRIRNATVHSGKGSSMVRDAIYSLEYYYFLLLDDILDKLCSKDYKKTFDINEYFNRLNRSYENYKLLINKEIPEKDIYKFFVLPYFVL
jgi:hypothetical protein